MLEREVELALVTSPVAQRALLQRVLFREDIVLVVGRDFGKLPSELEALPLILFPASTGFRAYLDQKLGAQRLARLVKMETDSVEATKSFVARPRRLETGRSARRRHAFCVSSRARRRDLDHGKSTRHAVDFGARITKEGVP